MRRTVTAMALAMMVLPAVATAQEETSENVDVIPFEDWNYLSLYENGWSAKILIDEFEVRDATGEDIGDVENIVIDKDGNVLSIIVEVGGFWDIGDTHVNVPWEEVSVTSDGEAIAVPLTEDNLGDYSLFVSGTLMAGKAQSQLIEVADDVVVVRAWKATELLGDYARLENGHAYGYVEDLIFVGTTLKAVVVAPDIGYGVRGPFAYPFYGYDARFDPSLDYYRLPYSKMEVMESEKFTLPNNE